MATFKGSGHLPGAPAIWDIKLEADWAKKEFTVHIPETGAKVTEFPGLMIQIIDDTEAVFRTRGIPPLQVHWWHIVKRHDGSLWGLVLSLPDDDGVWLQCGLLLTEE
jgi:hypothetical protein